MNIKIGGAEARALKAEIVETVTRRLNGDPRPPSDLFGVGLVALGEAAADMMFAAAQDKQHGERLLQVFNALVQSRWSVLATSQTSHHTGQAE